MSRLLVSLTLTLGLVAACSYKDSQRRVHDDKVDPQSTFVEGQGSPLNDLSSNERVQYIFDNRLEVEKKIKTDSTDVYSYMVKPLIPLFFADDYITSKDHDDLAAIQSVLHLFNKSIARMIEEQHALVTTKDLSKNLLIHYLNAVKLDCSNGRQSCNSLSFYKQDPTYSYKITMAATQILVSQWKESKSQGQVSVEDLRNQMTEIFSAFEFTLMLKGRYHDRSFDSFFVSFQSEAKSFVDEQKNSELTAHLDKVTALYKKLGGLLTLSGSLTNKNTAEYRQFLESLSPLNCSIKTSISEQGCSEVLFQDAIDYLLVDEKVTFDILGKVFDEDEKSDSLPIFSKEKNLTDSQKKLFKTSLSKLGKQEQALFVLVNRIYTETWSANQAGNLWRKIYTQSSNKSQLIDSLIAATDLYLKITFLDQGNKTFAHLRESFNSRDLVIGDRFQYVLSESDLPSRQWSDLNEKVMILENFLETQLTQLGVRNNKTIELIERLKTFPQNLKTTAVYPAMFTYATLLRGNRFDKFYTFDQRDFSYDDNTPFKMLLGNESPWFSFGTNTERISYSEAIFSAYFLFNSGYTDITAKIYEEKAPEKDVAKRSTEKLTRPDVLKYLVSDLFLGNLKDYEDYYRYLEENFSKKDYNELRLACNRINADLPVRANPFLLDIDASVFTGHKFQGMRGVINTFYSEDSTEFKYFKQIRGFLKRKIRLAELLKIAYKAHLNDKLSSGLISALQYDRELTAADTVIQEAMGEIKSLVSKYLGTFQRGHQLFNTCLYPLIEREYESQKFVRQHLNEHVKQVYLKMADLRGSLPQALAQDELKGLSADNLDLDLYLTGKNQVFTGAADLPENDPISYKSNSQMITQDTYTVTKLDTLLKIKEVLEAMSSDERKEIGVSVSVAMPPDIKKIELFEKPASEDIITVKWHDSYADFRSEYFKKVFQYTDDKKFFIGWQGTTTDIKFIPNRLDIFAESLLLGNSIQYVDGFCQKNSEKPDCSIPVGTIIDPKNLINEYVHIHSLLNLDVEDVDEVNFLKDLGRSTRFPLDEIRKLFFDDKQSAPLTFMEKLFDAMTEEILPTLKWGGTAGENRIPIGLGYITRFYVDQRDSQAMFFEKNDYMVKEERKLFLDETLELLGPTIEMVNRVEQTSCYLPPMVYGVNGDAVGGEADKELAGKAISCLDEISKQSPGTLSDSDKKSLREFFLKDERVNDFKRFIRENFYKFTDCEYVTKGSENKQFANSGKVQAFFELEEKGTCK